MDQQIIFPFSPDLKHYEALYFIVRCFDDRFREMFDKFINSLNIAHFDLESVAGGAKIFASPEKEGDRDFMFRELEKSIKLHHTKRVLLLTHHDCGAYGGIAKFDGNRDDEFTFHRKEHALAQKLLHNRFPDLTIESFFLDREGVMKLPKLTLGVSKRNSPKPQPSFAKASAFADRSRLRPTKVGGFSAPSSPG